MNDTCNCNTCVDALRVERDTLTAENAELRHDRQAGQVENERIRGLWKIADDELRSLRTAVARLKAAESEWQARRQVPITWELNKAMDDLFALVPSDGSWERETERVHEHMFPIAGECHACLADEDEVRAAREEGKQ